MDGFGRLEGGWDKEVKRVYYSWQCHFFFFFQGKTGDFIRQLTSLVLTNKFQNDWFKILHLGDTETTIRLGIKSC